MFQNGSFLSRLSSVKSWRVSTVFLGALGSAVMVTLPSVALMSQGRVYFNTPPLLIKSEATEKSAKAPSTYQFTIRVPEEAGEPLQALKITQRPNYSDVRFDQSATRAESIGELRLSQLVDRPSPTQTEQAIPSSNQLPTVNPSSIGGQTQYSSIRATALQPVYKGPMQPGGMGDGSSTDNYNQLSESELRAYRSDGKISPRDYAAQIRSGRQQDLKLASIGGDDVVPGEVVVNFDPPVRPGTTVRVSVRSLENPISGGTYLFGITAFPAGEMGYGQFLGYGRIQIYQ
jgi:Protein of unknown function (DUF2808)